MGDQSRRAALEAAAQQRILILDGAMGTMIQRHDPSEADYRGDRFKDHPHDVSGNNELLSLTRPEWISEIHEAFLDAGAEILSTNTFNANRISQADYKMEELSRELNLASAKLARAAADKFSTPERPRWVGGAIGPTNQTASISPDVNDPGYRAVTFDQLAAAYEEAARALIDGGVDILMVETIFDVLNAKAALYALEKLRDEGVDMPPIMISGTITDRSGRTLTGQTPEAFYVSMSHAKPFSIGLNCALGAAEMRPHIKAISDIAEMRVSAYPNAGLPNEMGGYDETPAETAAFLADWADEGMVNLVGGCCGTTPEHIRAIAEAVKGKAPRKPAAPSDQLRLSGLEMFEAPSSGAPDKIAEDAA